MLACPVPCYFFLIADMGRDCDGAWNGQKGSEGIIEARKANCPMVGGAASSHR